MLWIFLIVPMRRYTSELQNGIEKNRMYNYNLNFNNRKYGNKRILSNKKLNR